MCGTRAYPQVRALGVGCCRAGWAARSSPAPAVDAGCTSSRPRAVRPSTASRIDLGLILPATPANGRLESAARFNPLFTHRVRITAATDLDDELRGWLATAYALAG